MDSSPHLGTLSALAELLVDCADERTRERILVEAVQNLGWARSAALFRPDGSEPGGSWREIIAAGPAVLLVDAAQVAAMAEGALPCELPLGRQVLFAGEGAAATALALGGLEASEESLDLLEALFNVLVAVNEGEAKRCSSLLDRLHAPLPAADPEDRRGDREVHELRNLLTTINSAQALLDGFLGALPPPERDHWETKLGEECGRAGELLGSLLGAAALLDVPPSPPGATCHPAELLEELRDRETERLFADDIALQVELEPECSARLAPLGPEEFRMVLRALVCDSRLVMRRARRPGTIRIGLAAEGEEGLRLWVEDDCEQPGMRGTLPATGESGFGPAPPESYLGWAAGRLARAGFRLRFGAAGRIGAVRLEGSLTVPDNSPGI